MKLDKLAAFLDGTLKISDFAADSSMNGLQVESCSDVKRIATAVDVSEESIRKAAALRADLLVVHHGLFWGDQAPITGVMARRVGLLLSKGVSLYAAHLPLDCHPEIGNNAQLAGLLGLERRQPFGRYHGMIIGICGVPPRPIAPAGIARKLKRSLGADSTIFLFGPNRIRKLGIVSGGGASLALDAASAGCDTLLTGETSHSAYHAAREARLNLVCAGHYATETVGVRALGALVEAELGLPAKFIDLPTGL
ncbi:MAG TPA: Nif3-like dinuclear metal center hexameric protein [Candidatus Eisenbacteria bacterium]|uniref:GTP cyclohydrolase 1 type 2 homolog n=1 Tax=Eiseniibacteriota bacterium TaxID=2212470 RepID=A0A7V2AV31_UNCEI|nr:Nif3-like dinuclear metal center hexameric protein [Candidatus Eisenbacteria bacterium]